MKYTEIEMQDWHDIQLISIKQALIELDFNQPWGATNKVKIGNISIDVFISKVALGEKIYNKCIAENISFDIYDDDRYVYPRGWIINSLTSYFIKQTVEHLLKTS